jgi:predicted RNA-binding Zn ribbon-like protein
MVELLIDQSLLTPESRPLCLEFSNTLDWHASAAPEEKLTGYPDLVGWAVRAGILRQAQADRLIEAAGRDPAAADAVLQRARDLREAIYRLFTAIAHGQPTPDDDLALLNRALGEALGRQRLTHTAQGFTWGWREIDPPPLDRMLWPIARSAADLLTSPHLDRVGQCADDRGCGWLFLDTSRNHSRRWCGMDGCGNRAKARRYYARSRKSAAPA